MNTSPLRTQSSLSNHKNPFPPRAPYPTPRTTSLPREPPTHFRSQENFAYNHCTIRAPHSLYRMPPALLRILEKYYTVIVHATWYTHQLDPHLPLSLSMHISQPLFIYISVFLSIIYHFSMQTFISTHLSLSLCITLYHPPYTSLYISLYYSTSIAYALLNLTFYL